MENDDTPITFLTEIIAILERQSELIKEQKKEIGTVWKAITSLNERVGFLEKENSVDLANESVVSSLISRLKTVSDKLAINPSE